MGEVKTDKVADTAKSVLLPGMKEAFGQLPPEVLPEPPKVAEVKKEPEFLPPEEKPIEEYLKPKNYPGDY
jgi:hypothetical protein